MTRKPTFLTGDADRRTILKGALAGAAVIASPAVLRARQRR